MFNILEQYIPNKKIVFKIVFIFQYLQVLDTKENKFIADVGV